MKKTTLESPVIIFYKDIKEQKCEYKNGMWQLSVDICCKNCSHFQPYLDFYDVCKKCGTKIDFGIATLKDFPLAMNSQELANIFEEEMDSVFVTASLLEYSEPFVSIRTYGDNPYILMEFKNDLKIIKLYFFIEVNGNMFGFVTHYGCSVTENKYSSYDNGYIESKDFSLVLNRVKRSL